MGKEVEHRTSVSPLMKAFHKEKNKAEAFRNLLLHATSVDTQKLHTQKENMNVSCQSKRRLLESDADVKTTLEDRNKLCELHSKTKKTLDTLVEEIERLQKEKKMQDETVPCQRDAEAKQKVIENDKLQDSLGQQVFNLMRTLRSLEKTLKDSEHSDVPLPQPPPTSTNQVSPTSLPHPVCRTLSTEMKNTQVTSKKTMRPCQFIDDYDQYCIFCNQVFPLAKDLLTHLQKIHSHEMEHVAPTDRPWASLKYLPKMAAEGEASWLPLQGVDFLIPCSAFFCNLCKEFYGDVSTARNHLENEKHNFCYNRFCEDNPKYVQNMKEVHKVKKRETTNQGRKCKLTSDAPSAFKNKNTWSEKFRNEEIKKCTVAERNISKPFANKMPCNPDVVSDILEMMSQNLGRAKTESPAVFVKHGQQVSDLLEESSAKKIEKPNQDVDKVQETLVTIPESLQSPALAPRDKRGNDSASIAVATEKDHNNVHSDQLREAMEFYGKKTEIQSILKNNNGKRRRCVKSLHEDNEKVEKVVKFQRKCLPVQKKSDGGNLKKKCEKDFQQIRRRTHQQKRVLKSIAKESADMLRTKVPSITAPLCDINEPEVNSKESVLSPKAGSGIKLVSFCNKDKEEGTVDVQDDIHLKHLVVASVENRNERPNTSFGNDLEGKNRGNVVERTIVCETGRENISIPMLVYES